MIWIRIHKKESTQNPPKKAGIRIGIIKSTVFITFFQELKHIGDDDEPPEPATTPEPQFSPCSSSPESSSDDDHNGKS